MTLKPYVFQWLGSMILIADLFAFMAAGRESVILALAAMLLILLGSLVRIEDGR